MPGQRNVALEVVQRADVLEVVYPSEFRLAVLAHHPHDKFLLTAHGVICDVFQPVSHLLAVHPSRLIHHLDDSLVHKSIPLVNSSSTTDFTD